MGGQPKSPIVASTVYEWNCILSAFSSAALNPVSRFTAVQFTSGWVIKHSNGLAVVRYMPQFFKSSIGELAICNDFNNSRRWLLKLKKPLGLYLQWFYSSAVYLSRGDHLNFTIKSWRSVHWHQNLPINRWDLFILMSMVQGIITVSHYHFINANAKQVHASSHLSVRISPLATILVSIGVGLQVILKST